MYSNRRRSHIHFIIQYDVETNEYTGTRIVLFIKGGEKFIYDIEKFAIHRYTNSKTKRHDISMWKKVSTEISGVIKKEMTNYSLDKKYKMLHIIYESEVREIEEYLQECFKEQGIHIPIQLYNKIHEG
jgi:hypothetical protein